MRGIITKLFFLVFLLISEELAEARLRLKRAANSGEVCSNKPFVNNGQNVCVFKETRTIWTDVETHVTETVTTEVCCKKFFGCWKKCKRTKTYSKVKIRKVSRLVNYPVCFCCNGWSRSDEQSTECTKPICNPYCRNNGLCVGPDQCKCNQGFTGKYCQLDVDECALGNSCEQRCINLPGTYQCACNKGYVPNDPKSEKCNDIDECEKKPCTCASGNDECGAKCINTKGGYVCTCGAKFRLARNNLCVDNNECLTNPDICPHACVNTNGGYQCQCFQGFDYDPAKKECVAKDYCDGFKGGCEHECVPVFGGFVCTCNSGYYLSSDRHKCIDIDECANVNPCDPQSSRCVNTPGSYYCVCKAGFIKSGILCNDFDECENKTALCEQKCFNNVGSYTCGCDDGFKLNKDGITCDDIDECQSTGNVVCTQKCVNLIGSFACACNPGYSLKADKKTCQANLCTEIIDPFFGKAFCDGHTVGKSCTFTCNTGYETSGPVQRTCLPTGEWSGEKTQCLPKSCGSPTPPSNGKVSLPCDVNYGSTCPVTCEEGFILRGIELMKCDIVHNQLKWDIRNTRCEEIFVCKPNPCVNGGSCSIVTDTEYSCNCTGTGHTGQNCEKLVVAVSKIPKLTVNQVSPALFMSSKPLDAVQIVFYPEDPLIDFSQPSLTITKNKEESFTVTSKVSGLKWVSYEVVTNEPIQSLPDSLFFFYDATRSVTIPGSTILNYQKDCFHVKMTPTSCSNLKYKFSSTHLWQERNGGLLSTSGVVFLQMGSVMFPISLPKVSVSSFFHDFKDDATLEIEQQTKSGICTETPLSDSQLQTIIQNDYFAQDFIKQYNTLTPSWFLLSLEEKLKNIHVDNIRVHIWSGKRIKTDPYCQGAAIDDDSLFLVYLHHEKLTMKVYDKSISMKSNGKFCLLVDICKNEPHLVIPSDNYGHLETVFSFTEIQSLGWRVSVQSVGFRSGMESRDKRHCSTNTTQLAFGSANVNYNYNTYVSGAMQGNLFMNLISKDGRQKISSLHQCFDGESRFETPAWYTADVVHKKYTKALDSHKVIKTTSNVPKPTEDIFTVMQAKESIFKMKTGLKPVLQKSLSTINVNFMYKEKKGTSTGGTGDDNFAKITALQMLQIPLGDLELNMMSIIISTEPLISQFTTFQNKISEWNLKLMNDINECWGKFDDGSFILSKIRDHYYKTGPAITELTKLIAAFKADNLNSIDPIAIQKLESSLTDLTTLLKDLSKYAVIEKATKDFQFVTLNFISETCLFSPCIKNTNVTLYPAKYDLQLSGLCHDPSKGPYDVWQTEVKLLQTQEKGEFFTFHDEDKLYLCLSKHGVSAAKLMMTIKQMDSELKGVYILQNSQITIPKRNIKVFSKYDFSVNSTLNFELQNWEMVSMRSSGEADASSLFIKQLQKRLDEFSVQESIKLNDRVNNARHVMTQTGRDKSVLKIQIQNDDFPKVMDMRRRVENAKKLHKAAIENFKKWEKDYDFNRKKMLAIETSLNTKCTITTCPYKCVEIPKCEICQEPWAINKSVPVCQKYLEDRSYKYLKSEHDVCSHTVEDRVLKYTGTCKEPGPEPAYAQNVIDRLNEKIKKNIPLTLGDAYALESINKEKGLQLRLQIEKKIFFDNFPRRLTNCLLTEEEFQKLSSYTNQTFSDKIRKKMQDIKNAKIMNNITKKLNESETLTEEDFDKLRQIDPQLEKNIRKSVAISEITRKIQLTGTVTAEDLAKLDEIAPEYSKNITEVIKKQELQKLVLQSIQKKMENGTLSPKDLEELKSINPDAASKLEAALKEQLELKVKEMENKLKTVKGTIEQGLNNTGFTDLQNQLNVLSGSLKPYDKDSLRKLQEKLRENNATSGSLFEEVFERLDLGYDIKNITGNSHDLERVFNHFFAVLPKFNVPVLLQRNSVSASNGFQKIQEWFQMAGNIVNQACLKCTKNCQNEGNLKILLKYLGSSIKSFNSKVCKSSWQVGVKIQAITDICTIISQIENFSQTFHLKQQNQCDSLRTEIITPLNNIVRKWKDARETIEDMSKQQWKKGKITSEMVNNYKKFVLSIKSAFTVELGNRTIEFLQEDEIFNNVESKLTENSAVSLAEFEVLLELLTSIVKGIEILPNSIKQNEQQNMIAITASEQKTVTDNFSKLTVQLIQSLNDLCEDKKPDGDMKYKTLPILVSRSVTEFKSFMSSTKLSDILKYAQRFNQFAKTMLLHGDAIKNTMIPCTFRYEKEENIKDDVINTALDELRMFMKNVEPLQHKTIQDIANDIKNVMGSFSNGLTSPVGKFVDLMSQFIDDSPAFNVPMMLMLSPEVSSLAFASFQEYLISAQRFFDGIDDVLQKCKDDCSPEDIFGKINLIEIATKLDSYLKPISKKTSQFVRTVKITPKGISLLTTSFEEIRTALQTLSRSGTGFTKNGIKNIINAFKSGANVIKSIKGSTKELFSSLAGTSNIDLMNLKSALKTLGKTISLLYENSKGKLQNMKLLYEKIAKILKNVANKPEDIENSKGALEQRLSIVQDSADIINDVGSQFSVMYSMKLDPILSNYIDSSFAPTVAAQLNDVRNSNGQLLNNTKNIADVIGISVPSIDENTIFSTDISNLILDVANSLGSRKSTLAKSLATSSKSIANAINSFSKNAENIINNVMGTVSKYKDKYEQLRQKLEKYGKMYDEVETTLTELQNKPLSKIGEIKDSADELISSVAEYDFTQLLSADPEVVPRKVEEMQQLLNKTVLAFTEIDVILKKCNVCNVDNIFGYKYLKSLSVKLSDTFGRMLAKLKVYAEKVGDSAGELKHVKKATENIKERFDIIKNQKFTADTFKDISEALMKTASDVSTIQNGTSAVVKILFKKDIDFQVIGGTINNVLNEIGTVMNKSHAVAKKGERVYEKALNMKTIFLSLRENASGLVDGPLRSRIDIARSLAENTKELIEELPSLFNLTQDTLESVGINGKWIQRFGGQIEGLTTSIGSVLEKTDKVLKAADFAVIGYEDIRNKLPIVQNSFKKLSESKWDQMIPAAQEVAHNLGNIFDSAIDTTLKSANALNYSLTKNDLKMKVEGIVGKEKLAKYTYLFNNVSAAMTKLQNGPIGEIGKLTDSVESFVDGLKEYDFGKVLLENPRNLREKLLEFEQLADIAGGILKNIGEITGLCKKCDASPIFGKGFIRSFSTKLETTFEQIGKNLSSVIDRADLGLQGWEKIVGAANQISGNFKGLTKGGFSKETFSKAADALLKSASDVKTFTNGSADIFKAIFNGNNDMKYLQDNFEGLVSHVSDVLNRTAIVLPKAADVYQSVQDVKNIFNGITDNFNDVQEGPIESRIQVLRKITNGIKGIGKTLPIIFNQSADVITGLGIDSSWFRRVSRRMVNISNSLSNVVNKTDMVLNGAGLVLEDVRNIQGFSLSIAADYNRILNAPWKQKFIIFNEALEKIDKMLNSTDSISVTVEDTLKKAFGVDNNLSGSLGSITNKVSGMIGNISTAVKKIAIVHTDIVTTIDQIKSGPIQKIGKFTDETKEFVNSIKNYDLADILVLAPQFAKGKIGDLKTIILESGGILQNISGLISKHCTGCKLDKIFGKGFVGKLSNQITNNLENITNRVENVLDKIENASTKIGGIINSVKGIKGEVEKLKNIDFSKDGFQTISEVLHKSSNLFDLIKNDSAGVFTALFSDNQDLLKLQGQFGGIINQMSGFLDKAGNFSTDVANAFDKFEKLKKAFDSTKAGFANLTTGPIENRIEAVKDIVDGVNSIMKGFPEILKISNLTPQWLRSFGTKLEGITGGISAVLNKTKDIASGVGQTINGVREITNTAQIIGNDFKRLFGSGSVGGKIQIAKNIVEKVKLLTGQINTVANSTRDIFKTLTNRTLLKTDLIGGGAIGLLNNISNGLDIVADRYEKFRELSKSISEAFHNIKENPIKFALEELPRIFSQASNFTKLIYNDVKDVAKHLGFNLDKFSLDPKLVNAAKQFYVFAENALGAIGSGQALVTDFNNLINSKDFKAAISNFQKVLDSGSNFLESIDKLGASLFDKWDTIKEDFNGALKGVAETLGLNLEKMGGILEKGLAVGGEALSIFSNIQTLLNIKEFSPETVIKAANAILNVAKSGVIIANHFGANLATKGLQDAAQMMGVVTAVVQLYTGIKGFVDWLKDSCDITYKTVVIPKEISYVCLKEKEYIEDIKILMENCTFIEKEIIRGYHEGKLCCPSTECVYMQEITCLKQNEQCMEWREKYSSTLSNVEKQLITINQNYHNSSSAANARGKDVEIAEILLKGAELRLNISKASLIQAEQMNKKANLSHEILAEQLRLISKVVHRNKSVIIIQKAVFDITAYKPSIRLLPIRLHLVDQANQPSHLDLTVDKDREAESFTNAAHTIVASYADYIPIAKKRRRRSLSDSTSTEIGRHDKHYWASVCAIYREHYQTLYEITIDLSKSLQQPISIKTSKQRSSSKTDSKSTESEVTAALLSEISNLKSDYTNSLDNIIQRWLRSSENMMSSEIGSTCVGFNDCFKMFITNITTLFEPEMKEFDKIMEVLNLFKKTILEIASSRSNNLQNLREKVKNAVGFLDQLNKNAVVCDEEPTLVTRMPMSVFAYIGDDFSLTCTIEGPASMNYVWRRNGTVLPNQNRWKLELRSIDKRDWAYYTCEGTTLISKVESNRVLVRVYTRLHLSEEPVNHVIEYPGGEAVIFYCNGSADPDPSYKWWFKPYAASNAVLLGKKSILKIPNAFSANTGQYWCELSNGYSSIISRKATLDIIKVLQRKESARIHLDVATLENVIPCSLPEPKNAEMINTMIKAKLQTKIGLTETNNVLKLQYKNNETDNYKAKLLVDISSRNKQAQPRDSVSFALSVSSERAKMQTKVADFIDSMKESKGMVVNWKNDCKLTINTVKFSVDWQVEELNCPKGMGSSNDQTKCIQCPPGTFDDGKGSCSPCPVGTYQSKPSLTTCLPCGSDLLTVHDGSPSFTDCVKTEFKCNEPMNLFIVLDSSENVTLPEWSSIKDFTLRFTKHMDLTSTKISIAIFGDKTELKISYGDYQSDNGVLESLVEEITPVGGAYKLADTFELVDKLSRQSTDANVRDAVLFVTSQANQNSVLKNGILEASTLLQYRNVDIFMLLWKQNGDSINDVASVVSKPVSKHLFIAQSSDTLKEWSTATARAVCRNAF